MIISIWKTKLAGTLKQLKHIDFLTTKSFINNFVSLEEPFTDIY